MAKQIVTHYTMNPPAIRQRTVYVQYSNHKELKTESNPGQEVKTLLMHPHLKNIFIENFGRTESSSAIWRWPEPCSPSCCWKYGLQCYTWCFLSNIFKIRTSVENYYVHKK